MKIKKILAEVKQLKISKDYWESLTTIEQDYIRGRWPKDALPYMKQVISQARKQLPGFTRIYGAGRVERGGKTYVYSGEDTKRFFEIQGDKLIPFNGK